MSADPKELSVPLAEISNAPSAFELFLDRNQKGIVVFAILLAIGAGALVVYRGMETNRQEDAGAALVKAEDAAGYLAVVDSHEGTKAAGSAMSLLADRQWTDGKQDEAIGTLQKFISTYPDHAAVSTAKASLGSRLMAQGKTAEATKIFDSLVADSASAFIAPFALISLGDIARAEGDLAKAESNYAKVRTEFPTSEFVDTVTRRIATLKAKAPAEIAPPPTPEKKPEDPLSGLKSSLPPGISITPVPTPEGEAAPAESSTDTGASPPPVQDPAPVTGSDTPQPPPASAPPKP